MKNNKWSQKGLKIDDVALNGAFWTHKKSGVQISFRKWNPFVTDEFPYETLILRKRLSVLDNLFRSIRVSDKHSSVTPAIQYFNNLLQLRNFLHWYAQFKSTSSTFNPFWLHLLFFMHLLIFSTIRPWNWKALQINSEKVESWHGIIISPT